jgi:hypothetical protein
MRTTIIVKLQYEALHNWPGVVEALPDKPEIWFLKDPHRHIFHIMCEKTVTHSDRDVEIILFKRKILKWLDEYYQGNLGAISCEMLAQHIAGLFKCDMVEVLEDNENGGRVYMQW